MVYCCVKICKNSDPKVPKHQLPKDYELRKKWCESIDRPELIDIPDNKRSSYRVCDKHFSEEDMFETNRNRTNLKATAVPTINIPGAHGYSHFAEKMDTEIPERIMQDVPVPEPPKIFKCEYCENRAYQSKKALNKHYRQIHKIVTAVTYECMYEKCNETFSSKRQLQRHKNECSKKEQAFKSKNCTKYLSPMYLQSHIKTAHNSSNVCTVGFKELTGKTKFKCTDCGKMFLNEKHLIFHSKIHKKNDKRLLCPLEGCTNVYNRYSSLRNHLMVTHDASLTLERHEFESMQEFTEWKTEMEQSLKANYVMNTSRKPLKDSFCIYYECHRSLEPRLKESPKTESTGSRKMCKSCPSTLTAKFNGEKISVTFFPLHMGHSLDSNHLRFSEDDENQIAGKLARGLNANKVWIILEKKASAESI